MTSTALANSSLAANGASFLNQVAASTSLAGSTLAANGLSFLNQMEQLAGSRAANITGYFVAARAVKR